MAGMCAMAPRLEGSRAQEEAWTSFRLEASKADPQALAHAEATAKAKGKAKVRRPTWAEYQEMGKRLERMDDRITYLTWRLNLEKFRGCFGDEVVQQLFPSIAEHPSDRDLAVMAECMEVASEFEKRKRLTPEPRFSGSITGGELDSKRLRKEEEEEVEEEGLLSSEMQEMVKERSRLERQYVRLCSERRSPDFSGMTEAERAAEAERLRVETFQKASRLYKEGDIGAALQLEAETLVLDFDPKQGGIYYNSSLALVGLPTLDLAEESPIGPMRFTNKVFKEKELELHDAVNILSVKVASSDVGFPIQVYGTVIARDSTDYKRVYLFQRDREHCQLINSKDEPLILTGPKRGLLLLDENYVETDLMIKDHEGQDRELSKGVMTISGVAGRSLEECKVDTLSLAARLSTVKVVYAYVASAIEATISMEVEEGEFCGIVTACTTSIKNRLVLYDSQLADDMPGGNGRGAIKMMRPVISVFFEDKLVIFARVHGGKAVGVKITPRMNKENKVELTLGTAKMRLRVAWSILDQV